MKMNSIKKVVLTGLVAGFSLHPLFEIKAASTQPAPVSYGQTGTQPKIAVVPGGDYFVLGYENSSSCNFQIGQIDGTDYTDTMYQNLQPINKAYAVSYDMTITPSDNKLLFIGSAANNNMYFTTSTTSATNWEPVNPQAIPGIKGNNPSIAADNFDYVYLFYTYNNGLYYSLATNSGTSTGIQSFKWISLQNHVTLNGMTPSFPAVTAATIDDPSRGNFPAAVIGFYNSADSSIYCMTGCYNDAAGCMTFSVPQKVVSNAANQQFSLKLIPGNTILLAYTGKDNSFHFCEGNISDKNGSVVIGEWGPVNGYAPNNAASSSQIAIAGTCDGKFMEFHNDSNNNICYNIGDTMLPFIQGQQYASGYHPAVAFDTNNNVLELHDINNSIYCTTGSYNSATGSINGFQNSSSLFQGRCPSAALDLASPTGQFIEMHNDGASEELWYSTGNFNGGSLTWTTPGSANDYKTTGLYPSVAVYNGQVLETHHDRNLNLYYNTGTIDINGTVTWDPCGPYKCSGFGGMTASSMITPDGTPFMFDYRGWLVGHVFNGTLGGGWTPDIKIDIGQFPSFSINPAWMMTACHTDITGNIWVRTGSVDTVEKSIHASPAVALGARGTYPRISPLVNNHSIVVYNKGGNLYYSTCQFPSVVWHY